MTFRTCLPRFRALTVVYSKGCCSRPVYGLIFLYKWREDDPDKQEQTCPEEVWFANQVDIKNSPRRCCYN